MNWVSLPGIAWLGWLKNLPLRIGVLTGVYLTTIMAVALIVANRVPYLDGFAGIRNRACFALFALVAIVPACSFLRRPWHLFISGLTAWLVFSLAYAGAGRIFVSLFTRLRSPFNLFMIGAMFYGLVAVAVWLVHLIAAMRSHLAAHEHGRAYHKAE
jgi:hypothetical protein